MGLDAIVFCNCVERKRLKVPHPYPRLLYVSSNGAPDIRSKDPAKIDKHDEWMELPPCEHQSMMVDGCYLGNIGFIDRVRNALATVLRPPLPRCPILLGKVLYAGGHTGDHLTMSEVRRLDAELQTIRRLPLRRHGMSSTDFRSLTFVIAKLEKLIRTSRRIRKPIAF